MITLEIIKESERFDVEIKLQIINKQTRYRVRYCFRLCDIELDRDSFL